MDPNGAFSDAPFSTESAQPVEQLTEITSREQVLQTLSDIQKFFEQHEPSSPIPLLVQKVRNLVPKNFMDLLVEFETVAAGADVEVVASQDDAASSSCLLYTSPSPRDKRQSRMPSSA